MMLNCVSRDRFVDQYMYLTLRVDSFSCIPMGADTSIKSNSRVRGWSCEPNNQQNVCTTSVTEGEVARVKLV